MPFRPVAQSSSAPVRADAPGVPTRAPAQPPEPAPTKRTSNAPANKRAHHKVDRTGANWDDDGGYIVGKGRPPRSTRWKKGQSGNPQGPIKRETLSAQAQFERTFLAPFNATVNGETVPLTMDVFAVQSLKNSAVKGSVKAAQILLDVYASLIRKVAEQEPGPEVDTWEQEVIDRLLAEFNLPERPVIRQTNRKDPT